jgi:hypothetical protein
VRYSYSYIGGGVFKSAKIKQSKRSKQLKQWNFPIQTVLFFSYPSPVPSESPRTAQNSAERTKAKPKENSRHQKKKTHTSPTTTRALHLFQTNSQFPNSSISHFPFWGPPIVCPLGPFPTSARACVLLSFPFFLLEINLFTPHTA